MTNRRDLMKLLPTDPATRRLLLNALLQAEANAAGFTVPINVSRNSEDRTVHVYSATPFLKMDESMARELAVLIVEQCDLLPPKP